MKRNLSFGLLLLAALPFVSMSCSDDSDNTELKDREYTSKFAFYNVRSSNPSDFVQYPGMERFSGQKARIYVKGDNKAVLTISGEDYNLKNAGEGSADGIVPTPCAITGQSEFSFPIELTRDGNRYMFHGTAKAESVQFPYYGILEGDHLYLGIVRSINDDEVKLIPADGKDGKYWTATNDFMDISWDTEVAPDATSGVSANDILKYVITTPCTPDNYGVTTYSDDDVSILEILRDNLTQISFSKSTEVYVYKRTEVWGETEPFSQSFDKNPFTYIPTGKNTFTLYVTPENLFKLYFINTNEMQGNCHAWQILHKPAYKKLASSVIKALSPYNANGIPFRYTSDSESLTISFVTQENAKDFLKSIVTTVLSEPGCKETLLKNLRAIPELSANFPAIERFINSIDQAFDKTTRLSLSFNFNSARESHNWLNPDVD